MFKFAIFTQRYSGESNITQLYGGRGYPDHLPPPTPIFTNCYRIFYYYFYLGLCLLSCILHYINKGYKLYYNKYPKG